MTDVDSVRAGWAWLILLVSSLHNMKGRTSINWSLIDWVTKKSPWLQETTPKVIITPLAPDAAVPRHLALRALLQSDLRVVVGDLEEAVVAHRRPLVLPHDVAERVALQYRRPPFHGEVWRFRENYVTFSKTTRILDGQLDTFEWKVDWFPHGFVCILRTAEWRSKFIGV